MKLKLVVSGIFLIGLLTGVYAQKQGANFSVNLTFGSEVKDQIQDKGRMYLFISENLRAEPRTQTWPSPAEKTHIFARNVDQLDINSGFQIAPGQNWNHTSEWDLSAVPAGEYNIQVLWDQDFSESRIDAPGNLHSEKQKIVIDQDMEVDLVLTQMIPERGIVKHELSKVIDMKSEALSNWWGKPMHLKASILLPHNYDDSKAYPIRYNVAGYGGRYTRINGLLNNEKFMSWWDSEEAPQIITVFLDGEGPFGDSYQMDSENSGPYGEALTTEFIPYIESQYRGTDVSETRFVDGCSTGGWVSLGLQIYYPEVFNGTYSYSPDAIDFENYQLINIYRDQNAYVNEFGYPRPVMRSTMGEPMLSLKEFIQYENVLGASDTYLNSGGQFSAHTALYSPKGDDGLPQPLFDPTTGVIDGVVAEHWKKYDFKIYAAENWKELGPKLENKIFIWMGDMDHFYLNPATREFAKFIEQTTNPKSDAEILFTPMEGHCTLYSHKVVLEKIEEKLSEK